MIVLTPEWNEIDDRGAAAISEGFCPHCGMRLIARDPAHDQLGLAGDLSEVRVYATCHRCYFFYVVSDGAFETSHEDVSRAEVDSGNCDAGAVFQQMTIPRVKFA